MHATVSTETIKGSRLACDSSLLNLCSESFVGQRHGVITKHTIFDPTIELRVWVLPTNKLYGKPKSNGAKPPSTLAHVPSPCRNHATRILTDPSFVSLQELLAPHNLPGGDRVLCTEYPARHGQVRQGCERDGRDDPGAEPAYGSQDLRRDERQGAC